ncbi:hypothetical protein MMC12_006761 [Toensbergia leucococca]|nr:hypothetical protein [Toensbergia leucococca]
MTALLILKSTRLRPLHHLTRYTTRLGRQARFGLENLPQSHAHLRNFASAIETPTKLAYPETLLIYHSGTGRAVFIGCFKLTTIFLFTWSCFLLAPPFFNASEEPNWVAVAAIVGGAFPMVFAAYITAPFVNHVYIKIPFYARRSREHLMKWVQNIPPTTEIGLTTINFYGRPRATRMFVSDLRRTKARLGVANLVRILTPAQAAARRPWWMGKQPNLFYVATERVKSRQTSVWQKVFDQIKDS